MRRSEIYNELVDKVCEICEVRRALVIGERKLQAVVDARMLVVQYLRRIGLSNDDIALLMMREQAGDVKFFPPIDEVRKKARTVARIFNSYSERCMQSYAFCLASREVQLYCRQRYKDIGFAGLKPLPERD